MSKGYKLASDDPEPFEYVDMVPAGGLSSTADDMARFMRAYLNGGTLDGARILSPKSIQMMWANQHAIAPGLPAMGLGFYHMDRNGHMVVAHGGDTILFHSDLFLIPGAHVGVFFSQNSMGGDHGLLRGPLFDNFMARYFPAPPMANKPTWKTAKADAARVAGDYIGSRRSDSNFLRIGAMLGETSVSADADGTITVNSFKNTAGVPYKWREIAPLRWQQVHGQHILIARQKDGRIYQIASDRSAPIEITTRSSFWQSKAWNQPLLLATMAMLLLTVLFWPIKAVLNWRYERPFPLDGAAAMLYRGTRIVALIDLVFLGGWLTFLTLAGENISLLGPSSDPWLHVLQILGFLGIAGAIVPVLDFAAALVDWARPWWTKVTLFLTMLACLATVWFAVSQNLVGWSLNY